MRRSERFANWCTPDQTGQRAFVQRAECALLRNIAGLPGDWVLEVFKWKFSWSEYTDQMLSDAWDENRYEANWYHAHITETAPPPLVLPDTNAHALTHPVFWSTDFGRVPLSLEDRLLVEAKVLPLLTAVPDINREFCGQYLLALQCTGSDLPADRLAALTAWYDEADWPAWEHPTYHPYCVAAILFALRGD